jgi:hypothetical protein
MVSFALGLFFGGLAGYLGGWVDNLIQRVIEILRSLRAGPAASSARRGRGRASRAGRGSA